MIHRISNLWFHHPPCDTRPNRLSIASSPSLHGGGLGTGTFGRTPSGYAASPRKSTLRPPCIRLFKSHLPSLLQPSHLSQVCPVLQDSIKSDRSLATTPDSLFARYMIENNIDRILYSNNNVFKLRARGYLLTRSAALRNFMFAAQSRASLREGVTTASCQISILASAVRLIDQRIQFTREG